MNNERTKRTDIHRPSVIDPTEYQFVAFEYVPLDDIGACMYLQTQRQIIRDHMTRTNGHYSNHSHGGNCMVCGNVLAIYTVLFYHEKSNTYVRMGDICAQKCDMAFSNGDFEAFKRRVSDVREAASGKRRAAALLSDAGHAAAWMLYETEYNPNFQQEEITIRDIVGKLVKYGSVSDKSMNYIGVLLNKISNRAAIEAKRAAETEAAAPCPSGRLTVVGKVLSVKLKDTMYGPTYKMLIQHETGYKVYGTIPANLNIQRGDVVSFVATVKVSDDDMKFGFYSRPTNGKVLSSVTEKAA